MSIITTAQAVPSRLYTLYASLADSPGGENRERLEAWSTPASLRTRGGSEEDESSTTLFTNTLSEARKLNLVEEFDDKLKLAADARGGATKAAPGEAQFRDYLLRTLFDPDLAAETQQSAFMLALAWFLSLDPLRPAKFGDAPQVQLQATLGEHYKDTELTSLNRYQNFLYWARYLGFAILLGDFENERRVIPDPTRAVDRVLPAIFAGSAKLTASEFIARLAAIYPVFEGGSARSQVDRMSSRPHPNDEGKLSGATSLALQRLASRHRIELSQVADAPPLLMVVGARVTRVTHVEMARQ